MANTTRTVTPAEIAKVEALKSRCRSQFNIDGFITTVTKFYQLLIAMGFWPSGSLQIPTPDSPSIDVNLARELGYSEPAIDMMQRLPFPDHRIVYNRDLRLLEDTRILDLHDAEDLRRGRDPEETDYEASPNIESWIITLMAPSGQEGSVVLLDVNLGAIYQYKMVYGPPTATLFYRVQSHLSPNHTAETPGHLHPFAYHFAKPIPATAYFQALHEKYYSLRLLPFLDLPYENDVGADIERYIDEEFERGYMRRRQEAVKGLYEQMGWPGEGFDRERLLERWQELEKGFRREVLQRMRERDEAEGRGI